jgi:hypothetical protein
MGPFRDSRAATRAREEEAEAERCDEERERARFRERLRESPRDRRALVGATFGATLIVSLSLVVLWQVGASTAAQRPIPAPLLPSPVSPFPLSHDSPSPPPRAGGCSMGFVPADDSVQLKDARSVVAIIELQATLNGLGAPPARVDRSPRK